MKLIHLTIATAAAALLGGAALAQEPAAPAPSESTTAAAPLPADPTVSATTTTTTTEPAPAASTSGADVAAGAATFTNLTVTNGPVPDTAENRAKYGKPMSNAGKRTAPRGN